MNHVAGSGVLSCASVTGPHAHPCSLCRAGWACVGTGMDVMMWEGLQSVPVAG